METLLLIKKKKNNKIEQIEQLNKQLHFSSSYI